MELTKEDWRRADAIARALAADVDRNELGKVVAYAQHVKNTDKVLRLVERLPKSGYVRSGRTRGYLESISGVLHEKLSGLEGERALAVLTWAFRLITIYQADLKTHN